MTQRRQSPNCAPEPLTVLDRGGLARWLGISLRTLDRLQPPALPLPGKHYLVRDVLAWLDARRTAA